MIRPIVDYVVVFQVFNRIFPNFEPAVVTNVEFVVSAATVHDVDLIVFPAID